ncbi:hypothetical protein ACEPAG_2416 [Sanghuangporus baumii]
MSSNQNINITSIQPGGPERQPNFTGERDELVYNADGVPTFRNDSVVDPDPFAQQTTASDTLTGATSADVHSGLGHPGAGETSNELRHDGQKHRKKHGAGSEQWGTTRKEDLKVHPDEKTRDFDIDRVEANTDRV